MILQNFSASKWSIRALKTGMVLSIALMLSSCGGSDDDLVGNWVKLGDFSGLKRSAAVSVVLGDKVYVATGYYNGDDDDYRLNDTWEFDPSSQNWRQKADMPDEALPRNKAVGFGINGKVYLGTGYGEHVVEGITDEVKLQDFYVFDPDANSWTRLSDFGGGARYEAIAFAVDGKGYVGTGYNDNELKDLWQYDPGTDSWTQKTDYTGTKRRSAAVFVIEDIAYVCTGISNGTYQSDFYSYDASGDSWTKLRHIADISDEKYDDDYDDIVRTGASAFVMNGKGYIATGGRGGAGNTVWEYDPSTDLWDEKTEYEGSSRTEAVGFTVNGAGYVALGRSSTYQFSDVWRFEPNAEQDDTDNY